MEGLKRLLMNGIGWNTEVKMSASMGQDVENISDIDTPVEITERDDGWKGFQGTRDIF